MWALSPPPVRRNSRPRPNPSPPIPVRVGGPPIVVYMLQGGGGCVYELNMDNLFQQGGSITECAWIPKLGYEVHGVFYGLVTRWVSTVRLDG